jgi:hypothetical protein
MSTPRTATPAAIVQQAAAQLPWKHTCVLLGRVKPVRSNNWSPKWRGRMRHKLQARSLKVLVPAGELPPLK